KKVRAASILPFNRKTVVGVEIAADALRLVAMNTLDNKGEILDTKSVPMDLRAIKDSSELSLYIRDNLDTFTTELRSPEIWTFLPSSLVEIRHLHIPKVGRKQIANAIHWSIKKEGFYRELQDILDFEVQGEVVEKGVPKLSVLVYVAPEKEVRRVEALFTRSGYPLTGITVAPFALQNLFRTQWMAERSSTCANLHIDQDWSRIDIFSEGNLSLTRVIKTGKSSLVEALQDALGGTMSERLNLAAAGASPGAELGDAPGGEDFLFDTGRPAAGASLDNAQAEQLMTAALFGGSPSEESGAGINEHDVLSMIQPALERLARQVERTFEYYSTTLGNDRVEKIYISGAVEANDSIREFIGTHLGYNHALLDPLASELPFNGNGQDSSRRVERAELAYAAGLSLSDNARTPNFLYTYKEKESQRNVRLLNAVVYAGTLVLFLVLSGVFLWQQSVIQDKEQALTGLEGKIAEYTPKVDEALLMTMAAQAKQRQWAFKSFSQRYEAMAVLKEIAALTSSSIKLLNMNLELGKVEEGDLSKQSKILVLDGIVLGDTQISDAILAGYLLKLKNSPLFENPEVHKSELEEFAGEGRVLHFILNINLL
ncbi:MAG: pilus assembly protein PilM, partial [Desulfovibrionales bacterium]